MKRKYISVRRVAEIIKLNKSNVLKNLKKNKYGNIKSITVKGDKHYGCQNISVISIGDFKKIKSYVNSIYSEGIKSEDVE